MVNLKSNKIALISAFFLVLVMGSPNSKAEVVYTDIVDVEIALYESADFDIDEDGTDDVRVTMGDTNQVFTASPLGEAALGYIRLDNDPGAPGNCDTGDPSATDFALNIAFGDPVGPVALDPLYVGGWEDGTASLEGALCKPYNNVCGGWCYSSGEFPPKNLIVRLVRAGEFHYAWIKIDGGKSGTTKVLSYAYENCPNEEILSDAISGGATCGDSDDDGILDDTDNCPNTSNPNQTDIDGDLIGDACDPDIDGDGVANESDNCEFDNNPDQLDTDGDGAGDVCDTDLDGDNVIDADDACVPSPLGAVVNVDGCSITDLCPCETAWNNHGQYVKCVAHAAKDFVSAGLLDKSEMGDEVSNAAMTECGK